MSDENGTIGLKPCTGCGRCCLRWGGCGLGSASDMDMERLLMVPKVRPYLFDSAPFDLWADPKTGEEHEDGRCPWLRKLPNQDRYKCTIYDARPDACRAYPQDEESARLVRCDMIDEASDV